MDNLKMPSLVAGELDSRLSKLEQMVDHYGSCRAQQASWSTGGASPSAEVSQAWDPIAAKNAMMEQLNVLVRDLLMEQHATTGDDVPYVTVRIPVTSLTDQDCRRFGLSYTSST